MPADIELLKKLRNETQVSLADCRKALEEADNNYEKAKEILRKSGLEKAAKKSEREAKQGIVHSYIHGGGRVGVLVELDCETDFVARTEEFRKLAQEVSLQISAMNPANVDELLKQEYIREASKTIENLVKETIAKTGENIVIKRFTRFEIGE